MKVNVTNNIFDVENEHGCKRFEKNVFTILKRNSVFGEIVCHDAGVIMPLKTFAIIEVNKKVIKLTEKNIFAEEIETSKQKRNLFFEVLNNQIDNLKKQLN